MARGFTRRAAVVVGALVALAASGVGWPAPAMAATPFQDIASSGPLDHVYIGQDLSCQVSHVGDTLKQLFPSDIVPGDCGTFIAAGGVLYTPDFRAHGGTATGFTGGNTPFTAVSQSTVSGSGAANDPFKVTTVANAGATGLVITEVDTYFTTQEFYRTDVTIKNTSGGAQTGIIYRAGDCYLNGSDTGAGFSDATDKSVGCSKNANNTPADRIEQWKPLTPGNHFTEDRYSVVWDKIAAKTAFTDDCAQCGTTIDNGAGLSWDFNINPGAEATYSQLTTFSPTGQAPPPGTNPPPPGTGTGGPRPACPGPQWFLAEGNTKPGFDEYLLLLNTANAPATVNLTYLVAGGTNVSKQVNMNALERKTIVVFDPSQLGRGAEHGTIVQADKAILVERSMYVKATVDGLVIDGDHNAIAVGLPETSWSFAEGTTLSGFASLFSIANPNTSPATVTINYGIEGGGTKQATKTVPAQSRITVDAADGTDGVGPGVTGFATTISSGVPIMAERVIYFNRPFDFPDGVGQVNGATGAFGSQPGTNWYLAEGTVLPNFDEFLTLGNANATATTAKITYNLEGTAPIVKDVSIAANSRLTIPVFDADPTRGGIGRNVSNPVSRGVGATIVSPGLITVERIMYFDQVFDPTLPRINDGHAVSAWPRFNKVWYFAEGTGLFDFRTFLTLSNPQAATANVTVTYFPDDGTGSVAKNVTVGAGQRLTVQTYSANDPGGYGAGKTGFSIKVSSDQPILAERPEYEYHLFPDIGFVNGGNVSIGLPDECVPFS